MHQQFSRPELYGPPTTFTVEFQNGKITLWEQNDTGCPPFQYALEYNQAAWLEVVRSHAPHLIPAPPLDKPTLLSVLNLLERGLNMRGNKPAQLEFLEEALGRTFTSRKQVRADEIRALERAVLRKRGALEAQPLARFEAAI